MTDHEDLIRRLSVKFPRNTEAATAIKELVADLAAARKALREVTETPWQRWEEKHAPAIAAARADGGE